MDALVIALVFFGVHEALMSDRSSRRFISIVGNSRYSAVDEVHFWGAVGEVSLVCQPTDVGVLREVNQSDWPPEPRPANSGSRAHCGTVLLNLRQQPA